MKHIHVSKIIQLLYEEFDNLAKDITPDSFLGDVMEFNSINNLILVIMVEAEFDVIIRSEQLQDAMTIKDLGVLIYKLQTK